MDWREEYRDKGFVVVDNVLPHGVIDAHILEVAALMRRHGAIDSRTFSALPSSREDELMSANLDLHRRSESALRLVHHRVVRAILRQLFDAEPILAMARSGLWETGDMRAHVDTAFRSPDPPYSVCRTWFALEDIHPDSGCFYLVPGTHRTLTPHLCREVLDERPELQVLAAQAEADPRTWFRLHGRGWSYVSAKVADRIAPRSKVSPRLAKGDMIIFNPSVAHGTLPCADARLTRKMMVCEWTIEDSGFDARWTRRPTGLAEPRPRSGNLVDITPLLAARTASSRI